MTKEQMINILTGGKKYGSLDECIAELGEIAEWIKGAEQVVRCKDCVHWAKNNAHVTYGDCSNFVGVFVPKNWYCADGERKDSENDGCV